MSELINQIFEQYSQYSNIDISLELIAVFFGLLSVWFSKNNNVLVYPTGIINTSIFVYLLVKWELLGDMIINIYYFLMSMVGIIGLENPTIQDIPQSQECIQLILR